MRTDLCLVHGDVVKIELGVHIDGYVATNAHTIIISSTPAKTPFTGPTADVICAACTLIFLEYSILIFHSISHFNTHIYSIPTIFLDYASEAAARLIRPGKSSLEVVKAIQHIAATFHCQPCQQTATYITQRYIIEGDNKIDNQTIIDNKFIDTEGDMSFEAFDFEFDQVYSVNIIMSSGSGLTRVSPCHSHQVLQRDVNVVYPLKMKSARAVLSDLTKTYSVFPFACRDLFKMNAQHKHGITECLEHRNVVALPVLEEMDKHAIVAQFKFGLMLTRNGAIRLTSIGEGELQLPYVHSVYKLDSKTLSLCNEEMKSNAVVSNAMEL